MTVELDQFRAGIKALEDNVEVLRKTFNAVFDANLDDEKLKSARIAWREARGNLHGERRDLAVRLGETSTDPLVRFIVHEWLGCYSDESISILCVADQGFDAMDKVAAEAGWCGTWAGAVNDAVEANVLNLTEVQHLTFKLRAALINQFSVDDASDAMALVEELIQARLTESRDITT